MDNFKVDIDLIFKTLSGRALLLLNDSGIIVKANLDAAIMIGKSEIKDLEGKKWDLTFAKLSSDDFSFSEITNSITGFSNFALADTSSDKSELIKVKVDPVELTDDFPGKYYFITCRKQESKDWEDMLFQVMKGTEKDFGVNYIQSVTKALAKTLTVDFAFIGKLEGGSKKMAQTLSFWNKTKYKKPFKYALAGTPCEDIINKRQKLISKNVSQLYPEDTGLVNLGVESYFGTPIYYSSGEPMGLIVVMDSKPMLESSASAYILNIFASRVGAEIEWAEAQKSLAETDRKLRNVIDAIPHPIFYKDKKGRYEGINQAFMDAVKMDESNILGRTSLRRKGINKMARHDKKLLATAGSVTYESDQEQKPGQVKQYIMTKSSILDDNGNIEGLVGSSMDITDLKIAENELKVNEEKYRTLFSRANDAIFIMNEDLFVDCNDKTLEMFECTRDEIISHPPYEFSPKIQPDGLTSKDKALERINDALNGTSQNFYWKHKKKTGATFDAEVSLNAFYIARNYLSRLLLEM